MDSFTWSVTMSKWLSVFLFTVNETIHGLTGSGCWQLFKKCFSVILSTLPTIVYEKQVLAGWMLSPHAVPLFPILHNEQWPCPPIGPLQLYIMSLPFFASSFFFSDFIYLFMRDTHTERQRHRLRQKQTPCGEPDAGLDLRILGSQPEVKADA